MPFWPDRFHLETVRSGTAAVPFVGALDGFTSGLKGVWNIKKRLLASHTGSAFLCRADRTGQPTAEIGYLASGDWDEAALMSFAGSDSVYLVTPTEQSGCGLVLTQGTAFLQPRLVNAGVLETDGAYFNGSSSYLRITGMNVLDFLGPTASHFYLRTKIASPAADNFKVFNMTGGICDSWLPYRNGNVYIDIPMAGRFSGGTPSGLVGSLKDVSFERESTAGRFRVNGTTEISGTVGASNASATVNFTLGADENGVSPFQGHISSLVVWNTAANSDCVARNSALAAA